MKTIRVISILWLTFAVFSLIVSLTVVPWPEAKAAWFMWPIQCFFIAAAIGTLMKRKWGRTLALPASVFSLFAVPIGTVMGIMMLHHLKKEKEKFV